MTTRPVVGGPGSLGRQVWRSRASTPDHLLKSMRLTHSKKMRTNGRKQEDGQKKHKNQVIVQRTEPHSAPPPMGKVGVVSWRTPVYNFLE